MRLINSPLLPEDLTAEDKNLLWDFRWARGRAVRARHVLYGLRHALPKILYAMDMSDPAERANALAMLGQWPELCLEDALQLLSKNVAEKEVRAFAVKKLDVWASRGRVKRRTSCCRSRSPRSSARTCRR